jgi:hypothetical protein
MPGIKGLLGVARIRVVLTERITPEGSVVLPVPITLAAPAIAPAFIAVSSLLRKRGKTVSSALPFSAFRITASKAELPPPMPPVLAKVIVPRDAPFPEGVAICTASDAAAAMLLDGTTWKSSLYVKATDVGRGDGWVVPIAVSRKKPPPANPLPAVGSIRVSVSAVTVVLVPASARNGVAGNMPAICAGVMTFSGASTTSMKSDGNVVNEPDLNHQPASVATKFVS